MKKLVIFDLDGTLVDTIADLAASTNYALQQLGFPTHDIDSYKYFVGNGVMKLFERALPPEARTEKNINSIKDIFVPYYDKHNTDLSKPYPNIPKLLECLQAHGIQLAVASNKYHTATVKLVHHFFPNIRFSSIFGQIDGVPTKPNAQIIYNTLYKTGMATTETLYVGDSAVDMRTGANAKVYTCGVTWGFRTEQELLAERPQYIVHNPLEIVDIVQ